MFYQWTQWKLVKSETVLLLRFCFLLKEMAFVCLISLQLLQTAYSVMICKYNAKLSCNVHVFYINLCGRKFYLVVSEVLNCERTNFVHCGGLELCIKKAVGREICLEEDLAPSLMANPFVTPFHSFQRVTENCPSISIFKFSPLLRGKESVPCLAWSPHKHSCCSIQCT